MDLNAGFCGPRIIGDYIIGPKIGSGSFAVVWKSKHRVLGSEFAIKEIDKKHFNDNLRKEISILRNIKHPNIIRLFEAIETERRVYLVLEYCEGGDLGVYINRYGRVSEDIARHFMKQLAAGLQVLRENNLIHRDLKPQNLLLSGREVTPLLKIGDFGFARYLTQGLADTLCGSPLYMAPEIIQNHRYDAKADLWSVGAICYQLVIGKPPFDGNSQLQLFQNILKSTELQFPEGSLQVLKPDYVEFCRSLLRRNPVERLTFEEFFNHRFLMGPGTPRTTINLGSSSQIFQAESLATDDQVHHEDEMKPFERGTLDCSTNDEKRGISKDYSSTFRGRDVYGIIPNVAVDKIRHSIGDGSGIHSSSQIRGSYSLDSIEGEYVLVHSNFASMEILTSSLGTSLKEGLATKACDLAPKNKDKQLPTIPMTKGLAAKFTGGSDNILHSSATASGGPSIYREAEGLSILHPSRRLQFIHQCVGALSDLAREKFNAGSFLESFSVDLVVLALWKEAWQICNSWLMESGFPKSSSGIESASEGAASSSKAEDTIDFTNPSSVSFWAEQGFISACDGTEKLSKHLHDLDGAAEMPDAMEIIFQTAIAAGKDGAADEFAGNQESAAVMYSKALHLFSFIAGEAPLLPLTPPFYLSPDSKQQILRYIKSLEYHLSRSQISQPPSTEQLPSLGTK